ncbi:hypothetical protein [Burkholderia cepacia]|uniref:hypothetical protein n=1 Tax=Burkholderia cepacia TaxID=292 RepID=UPI0018C71CC0|nr:hypothetical protein [Burkholderia cepacia]
MGGTAGKVVIPATAMRVADGVDYRSAPPIASRRSQGRASWRQPSRRAVAPTGFDTQHTLRAQPLRRACSGRPQIRMRRCRPAVSALAHRHRVLELASIKMQPYSVLARLRIRRDDFGIYQGYRRYADIVAGHAPNAQDARIFAI